jgi:hypothetical protein
MTMLYSPWLKMKTSRKNRLFHPKNKNYEKNFSGIVPLCFF